MLPQLRKDRAKEVEALVLKVRAILKSLKSVQQDVNEAHWQGSESAGTCAAADLKQTANARAEYLHHGTYRDCTVGTFGALV